MVTYGDLLVLKVGKIVFFSKLVVDKTKSNDGKYIQNRFYGHTELAKFGRVFERIAKQSV